MGKTTVIYKDIAVGAAEAATASAAGQTQESEVQSLITGVETGAIITLENNRWLLDGTLNTFYDRSKCAFWSTGLSDENGEFENAPSITLSLSQQFSTTGISLNFDEATGEYCSLVNLKWYQGDELKADEDFAPDDVQYFCSLRVENYDKVIITLKKTCLPFRRAKLNHIVFGVIRTFTMNELRNASVTNEMDESGTTLPISKFSWTLDGLASVDYLFQLKQPVEVMNNSSLLGTYYIDTFNRQSSRVYKIDCNDAIGVLGDTPFDGGAYLDGISAKTLLDQLATPFSVEYADDVVDTTLKGVLKSETAREAIQQVIFAWGVCIATDGGSTLRVFNLPTTASVIPKDKTFTGTSVKAGAIVTQVSVTAHTYTQDTSGNVTIDGMKYKDVQTVYSVSNPDVGANDKANVKEVKSATLVSIDIGQSVAQRLYDFYTKRDQISARVVYSGEKLGDCVSIYTPWGTLSTGNLHKMEVTLSNTAVFKAEVTGT